jgi:acyl carrier protein
MKAETLQAVREFVSEELGVPAARIKPETRLLHDLGVDGDDAGDLLHHFSARFHVDLSAFRFSWHFGPEAGRNPLYCIYCFCLPEVVSEIYQ